MAEMCACSAELWLSVWVGLNVRLRYSHVFTGTSYQNFDFFEFKESCWQSFFLITAAISPLHRKTIKYVTPLYTDKSFTGPTHLKGQSSLYVARCVKWPPCISFWLPEDPQSCPTFDFYFLFLLFLFYFQFQFLLLWMLQRSSVSSCEANKWWACSHGDLIHAASHHFLIHIFFFFRSVPRICAQLHFLWKGQSRLIC